MEPRVVTIDEFAQYLYGKNATGTGGLWQPGDPQVLTAKRQLVSAELAVEAQISYELVDDPGAERTLFAGGESVVRLPGGLRTLTSVSADGYALDVDRMRLLGIHGRPHHLLMGIPWGAQSITVEGDWGFDECPDDLKNAILALAARDHFIRQNRQADISQSADGAASSYFDRMPTVAAAAIQRYMVPSL